MLDGCEAKIVLRNRVDPIWRRGRRLDACKNFSFVCKATGGREH